MIQVALFYLTTQTYNLTKSCVYNQAKNYLAWELPSLPFTTPTDVINTPKDDDTADVSIKGESWLPRIEEALILNLGDFVTHDYCQQLVQKEFFRDSDLKKKTGLVLFFLVVFQLLVATPIGWVLNFLSKLNILCSCNIPVYFNMDVPVNKLVSHALVQITFVVVLLLVLVNPVDIKCELDFDVFYHKLHVFNHEWPGFRSGFWINTLCLAMALGQFLSILEEMFQQTKSTRKIKSSRPLINSYNRFKRFFSSRYFNWRLLGLTLFLTGAAMRGAGYKLDTKFVCLEWDVTTFYHMIDDNYTSYKGGVVEVGTCLQGISVIIILSHLLQFLRLHPSVSTVFEGMLKCSWHVFSYGCTYVIITLTFSAGIYFLLPNASTQCNTGPSVARAQEIYCSCIKDNLKDNSLSYNFITNTNCSANNDSTTFMTLPRTLEAKSETFCDPKYVKNQTSSDPKKEDKCADQQLFTSYHDTTKYLFLEVFSPMVSVFTQIECKCGISRDVGLAMWYLYYFLVLTVLVNLLIALMSSTVSDIHTVDTWIYHRTLLWMRYCKKSYVVLPPPMDLIHYLLNLCCPPEDGQASSKKREKEYKNLIEELVTRYTNDMDTFEDNDVAMKETLEHLDRLVGEMNDKMNKILAKVQHK